LESGTETILVMTVGGEIGLRGGCHEDVKRDDDMLTKWAKDITGKYSC
jgi:hypothetical protein